MEIRHVVDTLHPLERRLLQLFQGKDTTTLSTRKLISLSEGQLNSVEILRASNWLAGKGLTKEQISEQVFIELTKQGEVYVDNQLPELTLLRYVQKNPGFSFQELRSSSQLDEDEFKFALGLLKRKQVVLIQKGAIFPSEQAQILSNQLSIGNEILNKVKQGEIEQRDVSEESFQEELTPEIEQLIKRGILHRKRRREVSISLTEEGVNALSIVDKEVLIEQITPEMIVDRAWKGRKIRAYDLSVSVPPQIPGKRHFVQQAIEYVRQVWLELGFEEMHGNFIESAFWNFDSLFVPQDHPAREMQDTFYMSNPSKAKLPENPEIIERVKATHKTGGNVGSKGWGGEWSEDETQRCVLRTHTTCLSARSIATLADEGRLPGKFFSVGKCFRNETVTWKSLLEFFQVEGIVVDPSVTFRDLIGYIRIYFAKMGFPDARFRPGFFPYTEPSMEVEVYHPVKKEWMELGGSGVFRPEMVEPILGKDVPVLAWGLTLGRVVMDRYGITDIRKLYENDLSFLRTAEIWTR